MTNLLVSISTLRQNPKNYGETPFIPLESYRTLMGVAEDMYPEFKRLNTRVIRDPIEEINKFTDFRVEPEYRKEKKKVTAVKFRVRRMLALPKPLGKQGALFPDLDDMPVIVHDLKEAGLAASDAWEIWQQRFDYVDASKRPKGVAFETYIQEKLHLLKKQQATGKVKSTTGFLLKAIKQNYANPEFISEKSKQLVTTEKNAGQGVEQKQRRLENQKNGLQTAHDRELHQLCERLVKDTPALLENAVTEVCKENPLLKKACQQGKALFENYQEKPMLRVMVDQYLMDYYPERFRTIRERYESQLVALESKTDIDKRAST